MTRRKNLASASVPRIVSILFKLHCMALSSAQFPSKETIEPGSKDLSQDQIKEAHGSRAGSLGKVVTVPFMRNLE